ncbi:MAG TPA: hypothetical protein VGP24_00545, partial [Glaciihabitans sp.]|nr:hypothetical protein [Glaciihabitans sp.]
AVAADLVAAAETRDSLSVTADMSPLTLLPTLDDASAAVIAAEAQWLAEQERLAAEAARLAAEAAARAEAERVAQAAQAAADAAAREAAETPTVRSAPPAAARNPESAPPPAPSAPATFDEYVWAAGGQGELDACKGSVDLTGIYGFPVIGEHWSCGGSRFPTAEGTTIRLSGVLEGLYRVGPIVAILNQKTNKTWDAPSNHDLLYQTCINGLNTQMSYAALTRIG